MLAPVPAQASESALAPVPAPASESVPSPANDQGSVDGWTIFRRSVAGALGVLVIAVAAYLVYQVRDLLVQILVALFVAVSLDPLVRWLVRRRVKRSIAVALILGTFAVLLGVLMWSGLSPMVSQVADLAGDFPGYVNDLRARSPALSDLEARFNLRSSVDSFAATFVDRIQDEAVAFGRRFLGALVSTLLVIVLTVYFMADLPRLRRSVVRLFLVRHRPRVSYALNVMIDKVGQYMIGNVLISLIAGVTSYVALLWLDVPFALPLAVFVAITDLIPMIGATLGAVVCTIVAVATTDLWPNVVHPRPVLRGVPAAGELPDRAAGSAQHRRYVVGGGPAGGAAGRKCAGTRRCVDGDPDRRRDQGACHADVAGPGRRSCRPGRRSRPGGWTRIRSR